MEIYKQNNQDPIPVETHQCNLVGVSGLIVQIVLGLLSLSVLVYKKIYEKPQRPFKIWILDSSKQVLSSLFAHLANMIFSIVLTNTGHEAQEFLLPHILSSPAQYIYEDQNENIPDVKNDPCNYYFITVIIDTSMGVFLSCFILSQLDLLLKKKGCEQLRTGNYYKEAKIHKRWKLVDEEQNEMNVPIEDTNYVEIDYLAWLIQLAIWLTITFITKMFLFFLQVLLKNPLGFISYYMLYWLNNSPIVKLVFVMIFMPTIMNGLQFWIQDNVLKKKSYSADTEEIEECESENAVIRKHLEFDEAYPNEEQYSTQMQKKERSSSFLQILGLQQMQSIANQNTELLSQLQLHNVSFSKNYNQNLRKDSITLGSNSEIPTNFQVSKLTDKQNQNENISSQLNKGFIQSQLITPINSEQADTASNQNKNNANKISKFQQYKDHSQLEGTSPSQSISNNDFTSNDAVKVHQRQKSQNEDKASQNKQNNNNNQSLSKK